MCLAMLWAQQHVGGCVDGKSAEFYNVAERRNSAKGAEEFSADLRELARLAAEGQLKPSVGATWAFEDAPKALQAIAKPGGHRGKQVVSVSGSESW